MSFNSKGFISIIWLGVSFYSKDIYENKCVHSQAWKWYSRAGENTICKTTHVNKRAPGEPPEEWFSEYDKCEILSSGDSDK